MGDFVEYNSSFSRLANYHYCNAFVADGYEALWMSNPFNQLIYFKDKEDYFFKKSISLPKRHKLAENIYGFAPYSLRLYGNYPFFRNPNVLLGFEKYIKPDIQDTLRKIDFLEVDVLWVSNPKTYWMVNVVKYKKLIYRIADNYRQFPEYSNIGPIEDLLIRKADIVIVSSSTLEQLVLDQGKKPIILCNGVEYEHFNNSCVKIPHEYQSQERKRIVYVGALKYWFDTELIKKIAEQIDADVFLIGKCETDLTILEKYNNVHILGARHYEILPGYLKYADVAIIPFIKSAITDSISPIKLFEYCSAGVAVVSSTMAEIVNLNPPIIIAENHEEFINGINHSLKKGYDSSALQKYGRLNSWKSRYEQLLKLL